MHANACESPHAPCIPIARALACRLQAPSQSPGRPPHSCLTCPRPTGPRGGAARRGPPRCGARGCRTAAQARATTGQLPTRCGGGGSSAGWGCGAGPCHAPPWRRHTAPAASSAHAGRGAGKGKAKEVEGQGGKQETGQRGAWVQRQGVCMGGKGRLVLIHRMPAVASTTTATWHVATWHMARPLLQAPRRSYPAPPHPHPWRPRPAPSTQRTPPLRTSSSSLSSTIPSPCSSSSCAQEPATRQVNRRHVSTLAMAHARRAQGVCCCHARASAP